MVVDGVFVNCCVRFLIVFVDIFVIDVIFFVLYVDINVKSFF